MPFNIERFRGSIAAGGYLENNKFKVTVGTPNFLLNSQINNLGTPSTTPDIIRSLEFRVESVTAPGVALTTADGIARYGIGTTQKFPTNASMNDISLSILSDGYGYIWQFWHNWVNAIFGFTGEMNAPSGTNSRLPTYQLTYKEDYSTTIQIVVYDAFGNAIQRIDLYEAFPSSIRETRLGWGESGQLIKLGIGISYTDFTIVGSTVERQFNAVENNIRRTRSEIDQ